MTLALALLLLTAAMPQQTASQPPPNYAHDVAPILNALCVACHHAEGPAPFALTSYQQARAHARQIAAVTQTKYMPPWLPDTALDHFVDQLELSQLQIQTLAAWAQAGAPAGDLAQAPRPPSFDGGWQLGQPDMVLTAAAPWTMPASSVDVYRNFVFRVPIAQSKYVRAVEIRPGNTRIVHHANVLIDTTQLSRKHDGEDGLPGFAGMDLTLASDTFDPESHFIYWKPGAVVWSEPRGMAWQLDPGTDLVLNMHLQASGKPETVAPQIGLYFTNDPPTLHPMLLKLDADDQLDIPAGDSDFRVHDDFTLPVDVEVTAIYPHAHYLGHELDTYATLPGGAVVWLEKIPQWDQNWQGIYRYSQPVRLPQGTVISMRYSYDNSAGNVRNPSTPPHRVVAGNSSTDEMAHVQLQVLPVPAQVAGQDARLLLQRALMQHTLVRRPADFSAHFNLGAIAMLEQKPAVAEAEFRAAVAAQPTNAPAWNGLGAALRQLGQDADANAAFRRATQADPAYVDAHFNLAMGLANAGEFRGAIAEFEAVLRLHPADAEAEANMGAAMAQLGEWAAADLHLQRALRLDPQNANAKQNIEVVRQNEGR